MACPGRDCRRRKDETELRICPGKCVEAELGHLMKEEDLEETRECFVPSAKERDCLRGLSMDEMPKKAVSADTD